MLTELRVEKVGIALFMFSEVTRTWKVSGWIKATRREPTGRTLKVSGWVKATRREPTGQGV